MDDELGQPSRQARRRRAPLRAAPEVSGADVRSETAVQRDLATDVRTEVQPDVVVDPDDEGGSPAGTDVRTQLRPDVALDPDDAEAVPVRPRRRRPPLPSRPSLTGLRPRLAPAAAVAMAGAVGAFVLTAAGTEPEPDPVVPVQPIVDQVRTETSAPRIEAAAAAPAQPADAGLPPELLVPGGDLEGISITDGVPETGGYTDLIRRYFGSHTVEAIVIVQCESNFDPNATGNNTNGTQDHGLFQINDVHMRTFEAVIGHPWADVYDPTLNTAFAAWLYDHAGGWGPWRCNRYLEQFDKAPEPDEDARRAPDGE